MKLITNIIQQARPHNWNVAWWNVDGASWRILWAPIETMAWSQNVRELI